MKPEAQITQRVIPPRINFLIEAEFVYRPTWTERWKMLIGYHLSVTYRGLAMHSPGQVKHHLNAKIREE